MSFVRVSFRWPGDPDPGRSALDEKRGMSTKPGNQKSRNAVGRHGAPTITLPKGAGEFSRLRLPKAGEAESPMQ